MFRMIADAVVELKAKGRENQLLVGGTLIEGQWWPADLMTADNRTDSAAAEIALQLELHLQLSPESACRRSYGCEAVIEHLFTLSYQRPKECMKSRYRTRSPARHATTAH